ncbi:MAG: hypothetical protein EOO60_00825 [Hymenobacter sp.]|nr:MAG: hypothetical protein EOO60_00825 [Hymenobacter sp.]
MLKHLTLALLFTGGVVVPTFAQTAPGATASQPKQFCRLLVNLRVNGTIIYSSLNYGQESKVAPVTDSELAAEAEKIKAFDSESLVLNYLSSRGWEVVGYTSITASYSSYLLQRPAK